LCEDALVDQRRRRSVRCETTGTFTTGETVVDRRRHGDAGATEVAENVDARALTDRIVRAVGSLA
jgi:inosine-uridine nucleoside N-ribohydrolase